MELKIDKNSWKKPYNVRLRILSRILYLFP